MRLAESVLEGVIFENKPDVWVVESAPKEQKCVCHHQRFNYHVKASVPRSGICVFTPRENHLARFIYRAVNLDDYAPRTPNYFCQIVVVIMFHSNGGALLMIDLSLIYLV